jgi:hypothetical protein
MTDGRTIIKTMPRQTTIYTCGAACIAAVARLNGCCIKEMTLAKKMKAKPVIGISNDVLYTTSKSVIGQAHCGEDVWDGDQIAILNILNPVSGVGHYVVALHKEANGDVIAYCPYYANTIRLEQRWLEDHWISGDLLYKRWAIVFQMDTNKDVICVGEEWPEMGLGRGEPNPYWMLRSMNRFVARVTVGGEFKN